MAADLWPVLLYTDGGADQAGDGAHFSAGCKPYKRRQGDVQTPIEGGPGGGGLLGLKKGTNCGPTSQELWLWQADMAKKKGGGGLSSHYMLPEGSCHSFEY